MTYREAYEKIRNAASAFTTDKVEGHIAVQINLCDEDAAGILYIEVKDGCIFIEPYDYVDRDAIFFLNTEDAEAAVSGRVSFASLAESGKLSVEGNYERAFELDKVFASVKPVKSVKSVKSVKKDAEAVRKGSAKESSGTAKPKTKPKSPAKKAEPAKEKAVKEKAAKEKAVKEKAVKAPKIAPKVASNTAVKKESK